MRALRFGKVRKLHSSVLRESKTACDQRPSWIPVAPATPRKLFKVRRLASRKINQNQQLTRTVLNPRSPEVWRKRPERTNFWASTGVSQCRGLLAKARVHCGFLALTSRQRIFGAVQLAERDDPESNILCFVEKLMAGQVLVLPRLMCGKPSRACCGSMCEARLRPPAGCTSAGGRNGSD